MLMSSAEQEACTLEARIFPFLKGKKLEVCLNENRQTMVRVVSMKENQALVSLHRLFLEAPDAVLQGLADFVFSSNKRLQRAGARSLRNFVEVESWKLDYRDRFPPSSVVTEGKVYDLQSIYEENNDKYFSGAIDARITWYGKHLKKSGGAFVCGEYHHPLRLIKIHRKLDQASIPEFYLSFVVYHEMLHSVIPPYIDSRGRCRLHGKEFLRRERAFSQFGQVKEWEEKHRELLFS